MWTRIAAAVPLLFCTLHLRAKEWNVPLPSPSTEYELEGVIGKHRIRMHLAVTDVYRCTDNHLQSIVGDEYSGWYEYVKVGKHIPIQGFYNSQGAGGASEHPPVEIYEAVDGKHTGVFETTQDNIFDGTWEDYGDPPKRLPYSLQIVNSNSLNPPEPDDAICPKHPHSTDETPEF
jgi:hypothetical protein